MVLSDKDPCGCTSIRLGGFNAHTTGRSFDHDYIESPCVGDGGDQIRNHYNLKCNDVDECALCTDNCGENALCTNNDGSFTCACMDGYTGDGIICTECSQPMALGMESGSISDSQLSASSFFVHDIWEVSALQKVD
ncbi:uncharacterized protein [Amphiura filiformis]|uniref:uncharacterized protein n=1 Tax=Amphiura filiformis TaxID=82378 RepID=UPI003B212EB1